jgi:hypothetical protein
MFIQLGRTQTSRFLTEKGVSNILYVAMTRGLKIKFFCSEVEIVAEVNFFTAFPKQTIFYELKNVFLF